MPQQPVSPGVRALEALGLTVFFATALFLGAVLVTWVARVPDSFSSVALVVSTALAVIAVVAMLVDAADLWLLGRRMRPSTVRIVRYLVFGAVLAAVVASIFGKNSVLVMYMLPSMIVYLFVSRRRPAPVRASGGRRGGAPVSRSAGSSAAGSQTRTTTVKAKQRRGGKKRR